MMENYLNPPAAAKEERGCSMKEMTPKLRATMERLHREAEWNAIMNQPRYVTHDMAMDAGEIDMEGMEY